MRELALHILDVVENALEANARHLELVIAHLNWTPVKSYNSSATFYSLLPPYDAGWASISRRAKED